MSVVLNICATKNIPRRQRGWHSAQFLPRLLPKNVDGICLSLVARYFLVFLFSLFFCQREKCLDHLEKRSDGPSVKILTVIFKSNDEILPSKCTLYVCVRCVSQSATALMTSTYSVIELVILNQLVKKKVCKKHSLTTFTLTVVLCMFFLCVVASSTTIC